jgi:hypothetical protein
MLEQRDTAERWLRARWPDLDGGIPKDELERAVAEEQFTEERRRYAVESARQRALQKFTVIREHPEIMRELWPQLTGRYTPEDYAMLEARLRPYIGEH